MPARTRPAAPARTPRDIGAALRERVAAQCAQLHAEWPRARAGDAAAVHRLRKGLQRLRTCVRVLAPCDPEWAANENRRLRRFRRQFSELRDAQVRLDVIVRMGASRRMQAQAATLAAAHESLLAAYRRTWTEQGTVAETWQRNGRSLQRLCERTTQWPFAALRATHLETAKRTAARRVRRALEAARDSRSRKLRHRLRQRLRAGNSLDQTVAELLAEPTPAATAQRAKLARALGKERDFWLAIRALKTDVPEAAQIVRAILRRLRRRNDRVIVKTRWPGLPRRRD